MQLHQVDAAGGCIHCMHADTIPVMLPTPACCCRSWRRAAAPVPTTAPVHAAVPTPAHVLAPVPTPAPAPSPSLAVMSHDAVGTDGMAAAEGACGKMIRGESATFWDTSGTPL